MKVSETLDKLEDLIGSVDNFVHHLLNFTEGAFGYMVVCEHNEVA